MITYIRTSITTLLFLTAITGVLYPALVYCLGSMIFPTSASGSLLQVKGKPVGSEWIGQSFSRPEYFWGRLSATAPHPYNAAASSGSNFGPQHPDLVKNALSRMDELRKYDSTIKMAPGDLVTASGSGLDPHISPAAATVQIPRVARERKLDKQVVEKLVKQHTEKPQFGILGEARVHVLRLNLALDALSHR